MANEFIARKGLIVPTGSITVLSGSVTATNFIGTASQAVTASYALNAQSSGFPFTGNAVITGSLNVTQAVTASFFKGDGSQLTGIDVGTAVVSDIYKFVGDGTTQLYVLSQSYVIDNINVSVDGLTFSPDIDYSYETGSITFVEAPPSSSNILVTALLNSNTKLSGSFTGSFIGDGRGLTNIPLAVNIDTYQFIGDGATVGYILSYSYQEKSVFVNVDGLGYNQPSDYSISGDTITFTSPPPSESVVYVKALVNTGNDVTGSFSGSFFGIVSSASYAFTSSYVHPSGLPSGVVSASSQVNTGSFTGSFNGTTVFTQLPNISIVADNHFFIADGATVDYALSQSYSPAILTVSVDGMVNALTEDYTVSGTQLSFLVAPPSASNILIKGIRLSLT